MRLGSLHEDGLKSLWFSRAGSSYHKAARRTWTFAVFKTLHQKFDQELAVGNGNHNDEYKPELLILTTLQLKKMLVSSVPVCTPKTFES
jgi:hypothetical protein